MYVHVLCIRIYATAHGITSIPFFLAVIDDRGCIAWRKTNPWQEKLDHDWLCFSQNVVGSCCILKIAMTWTWIVDRQWEAFIAWSVSCSALINQACSHNGLRLHHIYMYTELLLYSYLYTFYGTTLTENLMRAPVLLRWATSICSCSTICSSFNSGSGQKTHPVKIAMQICITMHQYKCGILIFAYLDSLGGTNHCRHTNKSLEAQYNR